jgi:hypothetical protein
MVTSRHQYDSVHVHMKTLVNAGNLYLVRARALYRHVKHGTDNVITGKKTVLLDRSWNLLPA